MSSHRPATRSEPTRGKTSIWPRGAWRLPLDEPQGGHAPHCIFVVAARTQKTQSAQHSSPPTRLKHHPAGRHTGAAAECGPAVSIRLPHLLMTRARRPMVTRCSCRRARERVGRPMGRAAARRDAQDGTACTKSRRRLGRATQAHRSSERGGDGTHCRTDGIARSARWQPVAPRV